MANDFHQHDKKGKKWRKPRENCSTSSILQRGFENGYDSILTVWIGFYPTILNGLISMINTDFIF